MAYSVSAPDVSGCSVIEKTLDEALAFAAMILREGDSVIIKPVTMTDKEVDNLPEFEGF